jgi:hypothetical protein
MKREIPSPSTEIEALLRIERTLPAQPDGLRVRALERARAALAGGSASALGRARPIAIRRALVFGLAACLTLVAIGAAAYQARRLWALRPLVAAELPEGRISKGPATGEPALPVEQAPLPVVAPSEIEPLAKPRVAIPARSVGGRDEDAFAEIRLLDRARQAVARDEFASAMTALTSHERRFPSGRLAEEREGLKITALLGLGQRDEARRVAVDFRKRFPRSVLLQRISEMLKAP